MAAIYDKFERVNWGANSNTATTNANDHRSARQAGPAPVPNAVVTRAPAPAQAANQAIRDSKGRRLPPANKPDAEVFGHNGLNPMRLVATPDHGALPWAQGSAYNGIFGNPTDGAYSIVVSGKNNTYHDLDRDDGDTLVYSADNPIGVNANNNVAFEQSSDTTALRRSRLTRRPLKMLRSAAGRNGNRKWAPYVGIIYDELYRVVEELQESNGQSGTVVKSQLRREPNQMPLATIRDTVPTRQQSIDDLKVKTKEIMELRRDQWQRAEALSEQYKRRQGGRV
ncbi:hypothetical protein N657DRAFT_636497 [Parathielavia appendiculata]|uniref:YDG domain-containing protein n=1 Tax=Parathielavia appendiculata TaxID=2587402 RepID=A0AAN6Z000_9PEZI|nr:hypothetical protein N657DRAFT_636497 [Parathielavia appendiculata]